MANLTEMLEIVRAACNESSNFPTKIWAENGKIFIQPPQGWPGNFADSFYDYEGWLEMGWILDADENTGNFILMPHTQ